MLGSGLTLDTAMAFLGVRVNLGIGETVEASSMGFATSGIGSGTSGTTSAMSGLVGAGTLTGVASTAGAALSYRGGTSGSATPGGLGNLWS